MIASLEQVRSHIADGAKAVGERRQFL